MRINLWLGTVLLFLCSLAAQAMSLQVQGNQLFATGPVEDDLLKFEDAFAKGGIDTVVFVNSPGGDLWTGLRIGRLIAANGYKTVIAGSCVSACSIMFMGGKERRFSDAFRPNQTLIGIHGAHNKDTKQINPAMQPQIFAFYKQHIGDKFNTSIMNQALYDMEDGGALLRVFDPVRSAKTAPYHCASGQTLREKCTIFKDVDAASMGIVTHTDLVTLNLPVAFKPRNAILGQTLQTKVANADTYLADLATRQCTSDTCKSELLKFSAKSENRAIAIPLGEQKGVGLSFDSDTPVQALVKAVYACNHTQGLPVRLCEPYVVNDYDITPIYRAAESAHKDAQVKLTVPTDKFYANEEFGGGFSSANSFRTEKMSDITPPKLDGISTVGTQELVRSLLSAKPPVVIDVGGTHNDGIPNSSMLLFGGLALEDAAQDAVFEKRFAALLALIAPDSAAPVAFYCASRNCWLSANAAMRAKKLGYSQVQWYRGGYESWKAARLPTATAILRAVAR